MRRATTAVLAAILCAACSGGGGDDPPPPPTTGSMKVLNVTPYTIHEVYATPNASTGWGVQRNSSPIAPSYSFTVDLAAGTWDAKAVSIGTSSPFFAYGWDLPVVVGQTLELYAETADFTGSVRVTNGSAYAITAVYMTPSDSTTWGPNQLAAPLASGASFLWYDVLPVSFDLRCDHSDGGSSTGRYWATSFNITSITCY